MKKALAVLHNPKSLLDFLWFYEAYGKKEYEYDIIPLCFGKDEEGKWKYTIDTFVKNSGIFKEIIPFNIDYIYEDKSIFFKTKKLIKMFFVAIFNHQKEFAYNELKLFFEVDKYDQIVSVFESTVFSGEIVNLSEMMEIVLLEDGERDYDVKRRFPTYNTIKKEGFQREIASFFLAHLGIADLVTQYRFKPLCNCLKFASFPDRVEKHIYREVKKLNDMSMIDRNSYSRLVAKTFDFDNSVFEEKIDYVIFTAPLSEHIDKSYVDVFFEFLAKSDIEGNVLLKRHPRDNGTYRFPKGICVYEIPSTIPAELFLDLISDAKCFFFWPSTLISVMNNPKSNIFTIFFKDYCNAKYNIETVRHDLSVLGIPDNQLICY